MALDGYKQMLAALPPETLHAKPETMIALLEHLSKRFGSVEGYAREAGVSEQAIGALRASLVE